jgi:hypothetical protein
LLIISSLVFTVFASGQASSWIFVIAAAAIRPSRIPSQSLKLLIFVRAFKIQSFLTVIANSWVCYSGLEMKGIKIAFTKQIKQYKVFYHLFVRVGSLFSFLVRILSSKFSGSPMEWSVSQVSL